MTVTDKIKKEISDTKTIGKSIITFVSGCLSVILTVMSGISSVNSAEDAVLLRNLSIGFGASISILHLLLYLIVDILISVCTETQADEKTLKDLFENDPNEKPDESIVEGTQMMLTILNQMKVAGNNLGPNTINDKDTFIAQLKALEDSLNKFGTSA